MITLLEYYEIFKTSLISVGRLIFLYTPQVLNMEPKNDGFQLVPFSGEPC